MLGFNTLTEVVNKYPASSKNPITKRELIKTATIKIVTNITFAINDLRIPFRLFVAIALIFLLITPLAKIQSALVPKMTQSNEEEIEVIGSLIEIRLRSAMLPMMPIRIPERMIAGTAIIFA